MLSKEDVNNLLLLRKSLEDEKTSWKKEWQEIIQFMGLAYGEGKVFDDKSAKHYHITDITAADSSNLLADGVAGYSFNRSLDWFDYIEDVPHSQADKATANSARIKVILQEMKAAAYEMLARSRFYIESRSFIRSCSDLGTAVMYFAWDQNKNSPIFKTLHLNDVDLIVNELGEVTGIFRTLHLTRRQAINLFGEENLPDDIKKAEKNSRTTFSIIQLIALATDWDFDIAGIGDYVSIYMYDGFERTIKEEKLRKKPFAVWRWQEQIYGGTWGVDSPGQMCLPLIKFVNILMDDLITLSELVAKGHWKKTKGLAVDFTAGSVTELEAGQDFAQVVHQGDLSWLSEHINYYRQMIQKKWNTEIFLVLTQNLDRTKTATEVAGLETEKSNLMSSFFAQIDDNFLDPLHTWLFDQISIFALPETLTKEDLNLFKDLQIKIDLVGPMYKEQQRNFRLAPTLLWLQDILQIGTITPDLLTKILDKINIDKFVDIDHDIRGADPSILIKTEDANKAREIRAQILQQQNQTAEDAAKLDQALSAYDTLVNKGVKNNG